MQQCQQLESWAALRHSQRKLEKSSRRTRKRRRIPPRRNQHIAAGDVGDPGDPAADDGAQGAPADAADADPVGAEQSEHSWLDLNSKCTTSFDAKRQILVLATYL